MKSTKHPISWHEENLKNMEDYLLQLEEEHRQHLIRINRLRHDIDLSYKQIETAKEEGKTEFDDERYCVTRKEK